MANLNFDDILELLGQFTISMYLFSQKNVLII